MRKSVVIIAVIVLLPLALIASAMLAVESQWFSDYVSGKLSNKWGRTVQWKGSLDVDWSLHPTVSVDQFRIDNADWAKHDKFARAESISAQVSIPAVFDGQLLVEQLQVAQPELHLARSQPHGNNWSFLRSPQKKQQEPLLQPRFQSITVNSGLTTYRVPWRDTALQVTVDSTDGQRLLVEGDGRLQGRPIALHLTGDPLQEAVGEVIREGADQQGYAVQGWLRWRGHELAVDGQTQTITSLGQMQFDVELAGPDADALANIFGYSTKAEDYRVAGQLQHQNQRWSMQGLDGHLGESQFSGSLAWDSAGQRPMLTADVQMSALDLNKTLPMLTGGSGDQSEQQSSKSWPEQLQALAQPLRQFNADIQAQLGQLQVRESTLQNLKADVQLEAGQLHVEPLAFSVGEGDVRVTADIDAAKPQLTGEAMATLDEVDLGKALTSYGYENLGHLGGEFKIRATENALVVGDSKLHYWKQNQNTDITATLGPRETDKGPMGIEMTADGTLRDRELAATFTGGPLLDLKSASEPYPLNLDLNFADTEIHMDGTVTQPLDMKDMKLRIEASGPDPAQLWHLTRIGFPHLPPYQVEGRLVREDQSWYIRELSGTVGDSDISGNVRWQTYADRTPMVWADLHSQQLDLDDFAPLWGGTPATGEGEKASPEQKKAAKAAAQDEEVLPEGKLLQERLQAMNARIEYNAEQFRAADIPFDDVVLDLYLENGLLKLEPLKVGLDPGAVNLNLTVDANPIPADGRLDFEISRLSMNQLLAPFEAANETRGLLGGRGEFWFHGSSVADALASLEGSMQLVMDSGRIDSALVEAAGVDVGETLLSFFGDKPEPDDIQCAYVSAKADEGTLATEHFIVATSDSNILGDAKANFATEEFNLVLEARPKDFSLFSGSSPVRFHGTFSNVRIDVVSDELVARGALAALGAVVFPPAAVLPLIETGDTEGQGGCHSLVAGSKQDESDAKVAQD